MKIFSAPQIREWDRFTIEQEPIASVALMDRAAEAFAEWLLRLYPDSGRPVCILAGMGNNGGDGVALARLLHRQGFSVFLYLFQYAQAEPSADCAAQLARLPQHEGVMVQWCSENTPLPNLPPQALVVDALFGSGLTRPLQGAWATLIAHLNTLPNVVLAIDLPSGLYADRHTDGPCVSADRTFSFETPKLAFFFPENAERVGQWDFGSIGLHPAFATTTETAFAYTTAMEVQSLWRPRAKFGHKGTYGHALLIAGSYGKMGAAVLAARACLRAGAGLLTVHAPCCGNIILQTAVPEAMFSADKAAKIWKSAPKIDPYQAIGVGCGIGTAPETAAALENLLRQAKVPLVLDADALNLLAQHQEWWPLVPHNSILTPHPKEFERLFGRASNDFERNALQRAKAQEYGVYIVLKGAHTAIATPQGKCWFNSTGNPGMATGGSGDVLTGILTGLLAQGYPPEAAALLGVYGHGLAGDRAAKVLGQAGLVAGDLVTHLTPGF